MLGAALLGLGYLALRSNPKKAKRRGGRPRGWKAVPRGVRRPKGRWKQTGRMARGRDLSGRFRPERGTWVQHHRGNRLSMGLVQEVLREERGRQHLKPGRGRNRRNPKLFDIICNGVDFAVVRAGQRPPPAWWIVRAGIENKEAAQRMIDSGRISQEMLALVNPRRRGNPGWRIAKMPHRSNATRWMRRHGGSPRRWTYLVISPAGETVASRPSMKSAKLAMKKAMEGTNPPGVDEHVYHKGGAKTICTSHVLAAFGIDACEYRYSGTSAQRVGVLRRNGFAVRSRLSRVGKGSSVGAARRAIRKLRDPAGTRYMLTLAYGGVVHAVLLDADGKTIVDTDPRDADRRKVYTLHAVYRK